ncbi:LacI family DNA-binding transcriptional regulator [Pseudoclavibacter sp. JSM 162008]|uniref:LacI family DNA-binding transcriptional regulator n=1 Tax=Pseudoclavibacter sp. JSM 162008 TaxID=3229855 RepID=UPI0035240836
MAKTARTATIIEVAKEAGVSTATAARALGNYGPVRESTREKVMLAAKKLKYQPNELARSMITGRTRSIGVICGDVHNPFFAGIVRGVTDVARERGYTVLIANSDEDWPTEVEAVATFSASGVDGLIASPAEPKRVDHLVDWSGRGKPVTFIDRASAKISTDAVVVDGPSAVQNAVETFFSLGHERIAIIGEFQDVDDMERVLSLNERALGQLDVFTLSPSNARLVGYLRAHAAAGKTVHPELVVRAGSYNLGAAEAATDALLSTTEVTAMIATDNVMSLGAYKALISSPLSIPDDVSFIGFDNQDWTDLVTPRITVIDQPSYPMGQQAARLLLERIDGLEGEPRIVTSPTVLIERDSVASPPSS